uniref:Uncharacterized protein n=1 Tax=Lotus japonicus TaxID=34305 RepID=I3STB6_LOTJA|nr:unknown [Lotus japonicus]
MRRGPANGSTQVAMMRMRKSQPDNANQMKKMVAKLLPTGLSINLLSCLRYCNENKKE